MIEVNLGRGRKLLAEVCFLSLEKKTISYGSIKPRDKNSPRQQRRAAEKPGCCMPVFGALQPLKVGIEYVHDEFREMRCPGRRAEAVLL